MEEYKGTLERSPEKEDPRSILDEIVREGARQMLQAAIENEVAEYQERYRHVIDDKGHRLAVHPGYLPERKILGGVGPLSIKQPRVDDRKLRKCKEGKPFRAFKGTDLFLLKPFHL